VLGANLKLIPYFQKTDVKGYARSMPTSAAIDRVAEKNGAKFFEVPTGWKYFGIYRIFRACMLKIFSLFYCLCII